MFADPKTLSKDALEKGTVFAPKFDEKGLILAITCDSETDEVLMAAYMNEEAIRLTFETGFVHYYSRSRHKIWKKGESSGEVQKFIEMRIDCDQDILQVMATQLGSGAACHTGKKSCLYRAVVYENDHFLLKDRGLVPLFNPEDKYK